MRRPNRKRAGFTLVELMVALTTGLVALGTIYTFSTGSTRFFQQQSTIGHTQQGVRVAFERLRRDITRAGFGGVPFAGLVLGPAPMMRVQAVEVCDGSGGNTIPNGAANLTHADRLILTGNYETGDTYLAASIGAGGTAITLQQGWPAFQRSFGNAANVCDQPRFDRVFQAGRLVHVKSREGAHFFAPIAGTAGNCQVQLGMGLPVGTAILAGVGEGAVVAPLSRIQYAVLDQAGLAAAGLSNLISPNPAAQALGDVPAVLVRQELLFGNTPCDAAAQVRPNTTEVVLEYVAHFDVDAIVDTSIPPSVVPVFQFQNDAAAHATSVGATAMVGPQQFRSLIVDLAARTANIDRNVPWVPRTGVAQPLSRFQVSANDPFAARVRSLRSEIALPNLFPLTQR